MSVLAEMGHPPQKGSLPFPVSKQSLLCFMLKIENEDFIFKTENNVFIFNAL